MRSILNDACPLASRLLLAAFLCLALEWATAAPAAVIEAATRALQAARGSSDPQLYERAERQLAALLVNAPEDPHVIALNGWLSMSRHAFASALEQAGRALAADPAQPIALAIRVDALTELGRYDQAVSAAQTLADRAALLTAYPRIAQLRFLHGDSAGAIELARSALALAPEGHAEHRWLSGDLARLLVEAGETQAAVELFQALPPRTAQEHGWLARALLASGRREAAAEQWREAHALQPMPEYGLALWKLARERHDDREAARFSRLLRGQARLDAAQGGLANRDFIEFHALDGRLEQAYALALAELHCRPDIFSEAQLSWILEKMGRTEEAATFAERAWRLGTRSHELAQWLNNGPGMRTPAQTASQP
ncbi:MAG: tetratricopeptide repeat protein [Candidatus Methylophosphatis roskildensis]